MNNMIRDTQLRVIDENNQQLGILSKDEAIAIAADKGLDLVLVAPDSKPAVAKIMDFGKFKFEQEKKLRDQKKKQKEIKQKEIQLSAAIGDHDIAVRVKNADKFLNDGDGIRIILRLRGREKAHPEVGLQTVEKFLSMITSPYKLDKKPAQEGFNITATLSSDKN